MRVNDLHWLSKMLAEWTGLEPATPGVTGRGSNEHPCGCPGDSYSKNLQILADSTGNAQIVFQRMSNAKLASGRRMRANAIGLREVLAGRLEHSHSASNAALSPHQNPKDGPLSWPHRRKSPAPTVRATLAVASAAQALRPLPTSAITTFAALRGGAGVGLAM